MSHLTPPVGPGDHVYGEADAPVVLVEFGDYECPFCGSAQAVVHEVLRRAGPAVRFAFRNFPLTEAHPHALLAAEAAEAAGAQGRFWEMHDLLFEHQDALDPADVLAYAGTLALDMARFARELDGHVHVAKVRHDFRSGVRSGVNGTPTFFVQGARIDGGWSLEALSAAVAVAIQASAA